MSNNEANNFLAASPPSLTVLSNSLVLGSGDSGVLAKQIANWKMNCIYSFHVVTPYFFIHLEPGGPQDVLSGSHWRM